MLPIYRSANLPICQYSFGLLDQLLVLNLKNIVKIPKNNAILFLKFVDIAIVVCEISNLISLVDPNFY